MSSNAADDERWFLVSGGSGGIGAAVCIALAECGIRPVIGYHRAEGRACELAERLRGLPLRLDLSDRASIEAAVGRLAELPRLSGAVLAASPPPHLAPFGQITEADLEEQWRVSVLGPQRLVAELVRRCFRKHKAGSVVGVLTQAMADERGRAAAGMGAYVIAKHGLQGVLALAAAEYPWLRVRTIKPGYTETPMLSAFDTRFLDIQRERAPFQAPESVAQLILQEAFES